MSKKKKKKKKKKKNRRRGRRERRGRGKKGEEEEEEEDDDDDDNNNNNTLSYEIIRFVTQVYISRGSGRCKTSQPPQILRGTASDPRPQCNLPS